jgi:hypothetical protein
MIAAELEVDPHQAHTVLERHVRDHLAELADGDQAAALIGRAFEHMEEFGLRRAS